MHDILVVFQRNGGTAPSWETSASPLRDFRTGFGTFARRDFRSEGGGAMGARVLMRRCMEAPAMHTRCGNELRNYGTAELCTIYYRNEFALPSTCGKLGAEKVDLDVLVWVDNLTNYNNNRRS